VQDLPSEVDPDEAAQAVKKVKTAVLALVHSLPHPAPPPLPLPPAPSDLPACVQSNLFLWTGVHTFQDLTDLANESKLNRDCRHALCLEAEVAATLVYGRSGLDEARTATIFSVNQTTISRAIRRVRPALATNVVPRWVRALTAEELKHDLPDECYDTYKTLACAVDGCLFETAFSSVPSVRAAERSENSANQSRKALVFVAPNDWIISIPPLLSPDRASEAYSFVESIKTDPNLRTFLFDSCVHVEPHRHLVFADRAHPDAKLAMAAIDGKNADHRPLIPPCGHHIEIGIPEFLDPGERQLSRMQAARSEYVTHMRQIIERANGRLKQFRLLRHALPSQMDSDELLEWTWIAAMLSNRYKKPLAAPSE
jgi:hypothetical protein